MASFLQLIITEQQNGIFLFFSSLAVLLLLKWLFTSQTRTRKNSPPSPPKFPLIGNLHQLGSGAHRTLWSLSRRYGPLMLLRCGRVPVLIASSADAAQEIMKTHDAVFSNRFKAKFTHRLLYESKDVSVAPYGEYWRQMRKICVLHLLSSKRVDSFRDVRHEEMALLIESVKRSAAAAVTVDISDLFMILTNDVVCRAAFGRRYSKGEEGRKFKKLLEGFMECAVVSIGDFIPWLSWVSRLNGMVAKVDMVFKDFDTFLDGVVQEHIDRRNRGGDCPEKQKDFVDVLLDVQKDNTVVGFPMERDSIKALTFDMFEAGTFTTFTVLEWTMAELLRDPRVMRKLQDEVRGTTAATKQLGVMVTEEDLKDMEYLGAVIKESLRLHAPVPLLLPRESTQDAKVLGYDVAARTLTMVNAWAIGRDPAWWGEDAEEFRPERFLNSSVDYRGKDFGLVPFGAGRRHCPGIEFGMSTVELVIANTVREFDWELGGGARGEDLDMSESAGFTIHRKYPLLALATPHQKL